MSHFQERFLERYGVALTPDEERAIARKIEAGEALYRGKAAGSASRYLVECPHSAKLAYVIFCHNTHRVITALPPKAKIVTRKRKHFHEIEDDGEPLPDPRGGPAVCATPWTTEAANTALAEQLKQIFEGVGQ